MKKLRKVFAVILSLAMVMAMSLTAVAADESGNKNTVKKITGVPSAQDSVTVKIEGISNDNATVTLYQIAIPIYEKGGFVKFNMANGYDGYNENGESLTADAIAELANNIATTKIKNAEGQEVLVQKVTPADAKVENGVYSATVGAGAYLAIITGSTAGYVYNPILLTASYAKTEEGAQTTTSLIGGTIDAANAKYIGGATAVAKRSEPKVKKELTNGTPDENDKKETIKTASVGDRLAYKVTPTLPSYPEGAVNKKLAVSDRPSAGLTFEFASLELAFGDKKAEKTTENGISTFTYNGKPVAYAKENAGGFDMTFVYDNLIKDETGATYQPVITYNVVVNDNAVVKGDGNDNTVTLYYTNQPNTNFNWDPTNPTVPSGEDVKTTDDKAKFYTYRVAFKKVGEDADAEALAGAIFGIYSDEKCETLVEKVTTNAEGRAFSSQVGAGDYYIKEIQAPAGYSLNTSVYKVTATWNTVTETHKGVTTTKRVYTADKNAAGRSEEQVGWLTDAGVFYNMNTSDEVRTAVGATHEAYLLSETITSEEDRSETAVNSDPVVESLLDLSTNATTSTITNTKLNSLPSTGGIGTTIFTIGGCIIMVAAAALFFASRRKSAK